MINDIKRGYDIVKIIGWDKTDMIVNMLGWDKIGIIVDTINSSNNSNFAKVKSILIKIVGLKDTMNIIKIVGFENIPKIIRVFSSK